MKRTTVYVEDLVGALFDLCARLHLGVQDSHGHPLAGVKDAVSAGLVVISDLRQSGYWRVPLCYALNLIPGTREQWHYGVIEDAIKECYK